MTELKMSDKASSVQNKLKSLEKFCTFFKKNDKNIWLLRSNIWKQEVA